MATCNHMEEWGGVSQERTMPYPGLSQRPLPWASVSSLVKQILCRFLFPVVKLGDYKSTNNFAIGEQKSQISLLRARCVPPHCQTGKNQLPLPNGSPGIHPLNQGPITDQHQLPKRVLGLTEELRSLALRPGWKQLAMPRYSGFPTWRLHPG